MFIGYLPRPAVQRQNASPEPLWPEFKGMGSMKPTKDDAKPVQLQRDLLHAAYDANGCRARPPYGTGSTCTASMCTLPSAFSALTSIAPGAFATKRNTPSETHWFAIVGGRF
jgi:hypothetical protein